ncbi:GTP cyclohydrolase I FolE2 [bacterium]|nr:GTP cyclohydrolase I FolE2 [Alphaproteobacteria bacterium]MBR1424073.1 GTP cyclohydrolase I FolE2 [bacterium]
MKDVQNTKDIRNVDIQKVGIKNVDLPLIIQRKNNSDQVVSGTARVAVSLPRNFKGTHMSRFIEVLNEWRNKNLLGVDIKGCLEKIIKKLHAESGELEFDFKYFINKHAPVSKLAAPMCYECSFEGYIDRGEYKFILGVKVPVTTLCPCSKEISEYGAHNQRAVISVKVSYPETKHIWLEDLIEMVESCASCPLYSLLKRQDEKYVTEHAWENPRFVEDVLRDVVVKLRNHPVVNEFEVDCEAFESIHNHSAWAYQKEIK